MDANLREQLRVNGGRQQEAIPGANTAALHCVILCVLCMCMYECVDAHEQVHTVVLLEDRQLHRNKNG